MGPLQAGGHAGIAEITRELKKIARSSAKVLRSVARRFTEEAGVPRCPLTPPQETRSPRARGLGPRKAELSEQRFPESALHEPGGQRSRSKRTETERTWRVRGQGKTEIPKFCIRQE